MLDEFRIQRRNRKLVWWICSAVGLVIVGSLPVVWLIAAGLQRLGDSYEVHDGQVYWRRVISHELRSVEQIVKDADAKTFSAFGFPKGRYGADSSHVFYEGRLLRGADPTTFEIIDHQKKLSRDADNEYVGSKKVRNDAESFVLLDPYYSKDVNGVYWFDRLIPEADTATFELIDSSLTERNSDGFFARDARYVYCNARVLAEADPETFRLIDANYGRDDEHVYYEHKLIKGANAANFHVRYDERYYTVGDDGRHLYRYGERINK